MYFSHGARRSVDVIVSAALEHRGGLQRVEEARKTPMRKLVTLTTDFGTRDSYVAQMKGVLYAIGPRELEVVDLTHEIGPQQLREAALFLRAAWPRFPAGTIHVVVVDPGVGSARRALACACGDQLWVGPDNGVMGLAAERFERIDAVALHPERFVSGPVSATFHGRDVFAPAAARLAHGDAIETLGELIDAMARLPWPVASRAQDALHGEVVHVDRFGNLISNISRVQVEELCATGELSTLRVRVGHSGWLPLVRCYADAAQGSVVALLGSSEWLEVAVTNGHACGQLGLSIGAPVVVSAAR